KTIETFIHKVNLDEFHSYVVVKLQNVKSTTVAVKGNQPCWEQEFIFETNRLDNGMMLELWNKGVLWDKLIGVHYIPLTSVQYSSAPGSGKWLQVDQELETRNGHTVGTSRPTGHSLLVDVRFELPFGQSLISVLQITKLRHILMFTFIVVAHLLFVYNIPFASTPLCYNRIIWKSI
uniref:C2 domain-containing protein n=1 Tax=Ascaris lumbricoides TaxID=6252 RepID=A0A0M3HZR8_ASCLU